MRTDIGEAFDSWWHLLDVWHALEGVEDAQFYANLRSEHPGPALDLGIGDGRVAALVRPEYGVDLSSTMLEKCRERLGTQTPLLLQENFTDYVLPEPTQFTYSPLNTLNHVPPDQREAVFRNVFEQTLPGGWFAFDSRVVSEARLRTANRIPVLAHRTPEHVIYQTASVLQWKTMEMQLDACIEFLDARGRVKERQYFAPMPFWNIHPEQFRALAQSTGWDVLHLWGNFGRAAFSDTSTIQAWVLQKP